MNKKVTIILFAIVVALTVSAVYLFTEIKALEKRLSAMEGQVQNNFVDVNSRLEKLKESTARLDDMASEAERDIEFQGQKLDRFADSTTKTEKELGSLKEQLFAKAKSELLTEILDKAAAQAVETVVNDESLILSDTFVDKIAKSLANNYLQQLQGKPGIDADNESVAKLLMADPEFLNRVSVDLVLTDK